MLMANQYWFYCNAKLDIIALKELIMAGFSTLSMGKDDFLKYIPSSIQNFTLIIMVLDPFSTKSIIQQVLPTAISEFCIKDEEISIEIVKLILETFANLIQRWDVRPELLSAYG